MKNLIKVFFILFSILSIQLLTNYTSNGTIIAQDACSQIYFTTADDYDGLDVNPASPHVGGVDAGNYLVYYNIDFNCGPSEMELCYGVTSGYAGKQVEIRLDGMGGSLLCTHTTISSGDWGTYIPRSEPLNFIPTGVHDIYIIAISGDYSDWGYGNFEWFKFNQGTVTNYNLTTTVAEGSGSVSPSGTTSHPENNQVTVTATPDLCYEFTHWSGDDQSTVNQISITMNGDKTLEAHFELTSHYLTFQTNGQGSITGQPQNPIDCGTQVNLTANADPGWHFLAWEGVDNSSFNSASLTMNSDRTVIVNFEQDQANYTLSTDVSGSGSITIDPDQTEYTPGTPVTLTAYPSNGYEFNGWTGTNPSTNNPYTFNINSNISLTANFIPEGGTSLWSGDASNITYGGNVGIGVDISTPQTLLNLAQNGNPTLRISGTYSDGSDDNAIIQLFEQENYPYTGFELKYNGTSDNNRFEINSYHASSTPINTISILRENGNVGIGTTSPGYTLDVNGNINIPDGYSFRINGTPISTGGGDSPWNSNANGIDYISGNVGIGTTTPGGLLGLKDANTYLNVDASNNLTFTDAVTGTKTLAELVSGGGTSLWQGDASAISYSGKVGIGASATTEKFLLSGNLLNQSQNKGFRIDMNVDCENVGYLDNYYGISVRLNGNANGNVIYGVSSYVQNTSTDNDDVIRAGYFSASGNNSMGIQCSGDDYGVWAFSANGTALFTSSLSGLALHANGTSYFNGSVGIGTDEPVYELDVKGTIRACEVRVNNDEGWCDYVFKEDYNLRDLQELELFVKTNKHLPEIPTATQVSENGIALGEMNTLLLKKIEELTLYVIEQNKKLEAQNKRIEELEKALGQE